MIFKSIKLATFSCLLWLHSMPILEAKDKLKVVTTLPDLAWLVNEIGGQYVDARALLNGTENPHFVDAMPNFIREVADADVVCVVGLDLEVGYMPSILAKSGNAKVQMAGPGYCETGLSVKVIEKPVGSIDRSMGDVHAGGNPHFFLSPRKMAEAGVTVRDVLSRVDPSHSKDFAAGLQAFTSKMDALSREINGKLEAFRKQQNGKPLLIEYHKEFSYFLAEYGLLSFGTIEEKPGVPPAAARLAEVATAAKNAGVKLVLAADYNPNKTLKRFEELAAIPLVTVPTMIQVKRANSSYAELQRSIADKLLQAVHFEAARKK